MWLSTLWRYKGLIALAALLAGSAGLATALKVQSTRLAAAQQARDIAIEAHDRLAQDWEKQKAVLNAREEQRKQQEEENAKLHQTLRGILSRHKAWATAPMPRDVVRVLQTLPAAAQPAPPAAAEANADSGLYRVDQRRPSLLGDLREKFRLEL